MPNDPDSQRVSARKSKPRTKRGLRDPRLFWRGKTIWCNVIDPKGSGQKVRLSTGCLDEAAATAKVNDFERTAADPSYRTAKDTTLEEAIRDLQVQKRNKGDAAETIKTYTDRLGVFVRDWGLHFSISKIDRALVKEWISARLQESNGRGGTISRTTLGVGLGALRAMLEEAEGLGKYHRSAGSVVPKGFGEQGQAVTRFPSQAEAWKIIDRLAQRRKHQYNGRRLALTCHDARLAYLIGTASRLAESGRGLRSHRQRTFVEVVGTKTKHIRTKAKAIPITDTCKPFLDYAHKQGLQGEVMFQSTNGALRAAIYDACESLGIGPFSPNDFRRAVCQWHKDQGFSIEMNALLLRHKDTTMVRTVYGQDDPSGVMLAARLKVEKKAIASGMRLVPNLYGAGESQSSQESQQQSPNQENSRFPEESVA